MTDPAPLRPIDSETAKPVRAEPKAWPDLKLVDENYEGESIILKKLAAATREGRRRERVKQAAERARLEGQHAGQLEGVTKAHEAELKRYQKLIGKAAFREGGLLGLVFGMGMAAALIAATYWIMKDAVILNTATQRVNQSLEAGPVPSLEQWQQQQERRQEPGAAP